jgi:protein SCO1/2
MPSLLAFVLACNQVPTYIVEGSVVEVRPPTEVVLDHKDIPGLMPAMIMPFDVADPHLLDGLHPGNLVVGRLVVDQQGAKIVKLRVTGEGTPPPPPAPEARGGPVHPGAIFPTFQVPVSDGTVWTIGDGSPPTIVTFIYSRCPLPKACPAIVGRLLALQDQLRGKGARILAITIDPAHDSLDVLKDYGAGKGADPAIFQFGRLDEEPLRGIADSAALRMLNSGNSEQIEHSIRLLVIGKDGRLIERYDDNQWPLDRVVSQLTTGGPPAPPGSDGTVFGE